MEIVPDTILRGRYRIVHQLGKGGMGAVYLAFDTTLETGVAVKSNLNPSKESSTQFLREARLLANLRHPNLPRVIDHFILEDNQFLVMDYVPGEDLGTLMEREGAQPVEDVLIWADEICSALTYLHSQTPSIIHRDIKPANLKLLPDGSIMLVDFGIAKAADTSQATATGAMGYTPGYAPPEQYGGARTGPFSDQYSLAATLYMLLTNQKPVDSVQRMLNQADISPINLLNPSVPPHVQWAIEKAMSVRPEDRFRSIAEFQAALNNPTAYQAAMASKTAAFATPETTQARTQPAPGYTPYQQPAPAYTPYQQPVAPPPTYYQGMAPAAPQAAIAPPAKAKRSLGWLFALVGGGGILLLGAAVVIGFFLMQNNGMFGTLPTPTSQKIVVVVTTEVPTDTPAPTDTSTPKPVATKTSAPVVAKPTQTATVSLRPVGDGKPIAFVSNRSDGKTFQIWTMKVYLDNAGKPVGGDFKQITNDDGDKHQPAWSPDGMRMLYTGPGKDGTGTDIYSLDLSKEGSKGVDITPDIKGDETDPVWSPDGRWIAFVNKGRYTNVRQIYVSNPDGITNRHRLSLDFEEYRPIWSPDMQWLLYVINASDHNYFYVRNKTADYATPQPYDPTSFWGRLGEVGEPAWSYDGTHIAYTKINGASKQIGSVLFKSKGATASILTPDSNKESHPTWSPDSQWIAFTSERDGNAHIYAMTAAGLLQTNLTNSSTQDLDPAWQP